MPFMAVFKGVRKVCFTVFPVIMNRLVFMGGEGGNSIYKVTYHKNSPRVWTTY